MTSCPSGQLGVATVSPLARAAAAILGAARLQESALALEEAAHDGRAENGVDLVADISREIERVLAFFADPAWAERLDAEPAS